MTALTGLFPGSWSEERVVIVQRGMLTARSKKEGCSRLGVLWVLGAIVRRGTYRSELHFPALTEQILGLEWAQALLEPFGIGGAGWSCCHEDKEESKKGEKGPESSEHDGLARG